MAAQSDTKKSKRASRLPKRPRGTEWKAKVHPFFIQVAEVQKKVNLLSRTGNPEDRAESQRMIRNPTPEILEAADRFADERRKAGLPYRDIAGALLTIDERQPLGATISDEDFTLAWLAWNHYGMTFRKLLEEDAAGMRESSKRVLAIYKEFQRWRYREQDPEKPRKDSVQVRPGSSKPVDVRIRSGYRSPFR